MRKAIAVALIAAGLVLVTPPDTASASTGCVTRSEFNEVHRYAIDRSLYGVSRDRVRVTFGTPGQRIAFDPSGGIFGGDSQGSGSELRAYRTCSPGDAVWIMFWRSDHGPPVIEWKSGSRLGSDGRISPAMWWFN